MRTVNLRKSVVHILRRLSVRSRTDRRIGNRSVLPVNNSLQADALRTLKDHARTVNQAGFAAAESVTVGECAQLTRESIQHALESGDYGRAQFILERLPDGDDRDRCMLNLCRCVTGDLISALMDLRDWSHMTSFPGDARTLYALLLDEEGEHAEALRVLNYEHSDCNNSSINSITNFLKAILLMRSRQVEEARCIARKHPTKFFRWQRIGLIERENHEIDEVAQLADEIIKHESVLKSLVEGLRCDPVDEHITVLTGAVYRALDHLEDRPGAFESLAMLHLLAGEHREARKWVLRGLREFPRCSSLLLLLLQLPSDYHLSSHSILPHVGIAPRIPVDEAKISLVDSQVASVKKPAQHAALSVIISKKGDA